MASATRPRAADTRLDLVDVSWAGFKRMLKVRGDRSSPRIWYLDGSLTLVSPSLPHELHSRRLGRFVSEVVTELAIPCLAVGATTLSRADLKVAVEGDEVFYLANAERIRGKTELDLNVDPPPDLAIEVVITHGAKKAMTIYRRLGVPELWVCTPKRLRFYRLGADGTYAETPRSLAFPFLSAEEVFSWVSQPHASLESEWTLRLRAWVRDELAPRARAGGRPDGD
ncbi:Uma2 family endonuclease [Tautonia plasticadhaerens]|uniref:Putative restriction endonuclease domain-containing protein n=1 Tax=Tautonia plasticadhaerens TaxID=2527974 RepID=A0A518HC41_9BACT|nr:Uma2 family endonuclease [Tautonia plasticadhaerens]QDV38409.1 hypothetical protein ElP_63640 [Tautonia plasticadhaerens]